MSRRYTSTFEKFLPHLRHFSSTKSPITFATRLPHMHRRSQGTPVVSRPSTAAAPLILRVRISLVTKGRYPFWGSRLNGGNSSCSELCVRP